MIPGPVAARAPIDPNVACRPQGELGGEELDAGTSFADLLAAMLAPGAAGAQLQAAASAPAEAVFERLDAAEIFNETGLFRGPAPLPSADATPPAESSAAPPPCVRPAASAPGLQADLQVPLSPRIGKAPAAIEITTAPVGRRAAGGTASPGAPLSISRAAQRAMLSPPPAGAARGGKPALEVAGPGRGGPRAQAMLARLLAAKTGAAAAQVSVQAVEGGINVIARIDKLSREERDRLRVEIGALLTRHGYGPVEILLNGEARPLPQGEED